MVEKKTIAILYNSVEEVKKGNKEDVLADNDNEKAANDVYKALINLGHDVTLYDVNHKTLKLVEKIKADVIFNLLEGFDSLPNSMSSIFSYIESLNMPITGCSSFSSLITTDKARTKNFLVRNKIPTPDYQIFLSDNESLKYSLRYPLIAKPNSNDCSIGITQDSVVKNFSELREQINLIKNEYKDATLVEEYINGRELEVMAVKLKDEIIVFPILEGIFSEDNERKWDICDFKHKWGKTSYCISEECPARIPEDIVLKINTMIKDCFRIFDLKGYARLDIRLSDQGVPYVLEVNTNPGLSLVGRSTNMPCVKAFGVSYEDFLQMIVDAALYEFEYSNVAHKSFLKSSDLVKS